MNADTVIVRARDAEIEVLRALLKQFEDGGMSGHEVREAKADERTRFERECAMRLLAAVSLATGDHFPTVIESAAKLADHYFGAKEANG